MVGRKRVWELLNLDDEREGDVEKEKEMRRVEGEKRVRIEVGKILDEVEEKIRKERVIMMKKDVVGEEGETVEDGGGLMEGWKARIPEGNAGKLSLERGMANLEVR